MTKYKRVVIKVGTKVLTSQDRTLDRQRVKQLVSQISDMKDKGVEVVLVTSGAIGAGLGLLGLKKRSSNMFELQATASIGQGHLMQVYSEYFKERGYLAGQILLTQEDFNERQRYLNIKHTISALLKYKAVPVINENDTVATEEIRCGDNDRLSSLLSDLVGADKLIILTDVDGLMDSDGRVISFVDAFTPKIMKLGVSSKCDLGTGGMATKLEAIRRVTASGIECVIANGRIDGVILKIIEGHSIGTLFRTRPARLIAKKRWIAFSSRPKGALTVDEGAKLALSKKDKSLLASGVVSVSGDFSAGDAIKIVDKEGKEFARGLANYSSGDLSRIKGKRTADFKSILGYDGPDEVVHKDNLAIL